jgi:hypothetical protein
MRPPPLLDGDRKSYAVRHAQQRQQAAQQSLLRRLWGKMLEPHLVAAGRGAIAWRICAGAGAVSVRPASPEPHSTRPRAAGPKYFASDVSSASKAPHASANFLHPLDAQPLASGAWAVGWQRTQGGGR